MKSFVTISFFITVALFLSSCNRHFTKFPMYHSTLRKIPTDKIKQQVVFTKNMVSKIVSISVVCRDNGGEGGSQFIPRAKVIQNEEYDITKLLYNYFAKIKSDGAYPIIYDGSGVNDSIYKSIYNNAFINTYHHQMMQSIDFTNVKQDGIYLVVTYLIQWTSGYGPSISENAGGGGLP